MLLKNGELQRRVEILNYMYRKCVLCPHRCSVDRTSGELGICGQGCEPVVASSNVHNGEEPPISGRLGSGTIFFSGCAGRCVFCQNFPISQLNTGNTVSTEVLAGMMLDLQDKGCHNINFVTPTHFVPSLVAALKIAAEAGLNIPIVYNTSGYERVELLRLLDGIIDVYLPDIKYSDDAVAEELSGLREYVSHNRSAIIEMYHQVGRLKMRRGIAVSGLIIRHLILPCGLSGTNDSMEFISQELSPDIHVSLMDQYFPAYLSNDDPRLNRRINSQEYDGALDSFDRNGLHNGWIQDHLSV